jgi:hypothetical protein
VSKGFAMFKWVISVIVHRASKVSKQANQGENKSTNSCQDSQRFASNVITYFRRSLSDSQLCQRSVYKRLHIELNDVWEHFHTYICLAWQTFKAKWKMYGQKITLNMSGNPLHEVRIYKFLQHKMFIYLYLCPVQIFLDTPVAFFIFCCFKHSDLDICTLEFLFRRHHVHGIRPSKPFLEFALLEK